MISAKVCYIYIYTLYIYVYTMYTHIIHIWSAAAFVLPRKWYSQKYIISTYIHFIHIHILCTYILYIYDLLLLLCCRTSDIRKSGLNIYIYYIIYIYIYIYVYIHIYVYHMCSIYIWFAVAFVQPSKWYSQKYIIYTYIQCIHIHILWKYILCIYDLHIW